MEQKLKFPLDPKRVYTFTGAELDQLLTEYSTRVAADAAMRVLQVYGDPEKMMEGYLKATQN